MMMPPPVAAPMMTPRSQQPRSGRLKSAQPVPADARRACSAAAVAIGRRDAPDRLPEGLREREAPSPRKAVDEIAFAGNYR